MIAALIPGDQDLPCLRWRRASLPSTAALAEAVEPPVLRADDDAAGGDGGGGGKRGAGFEIPELLAGRQIEHVEVAVVGTYVDAIARGKLHG